MTDSSPIDRTFATARAAGRLAFMPFVTAGDPDVAMTLDILRQLADEGVDLIEIGFPYSDPIADGPVIQASYTRALAAGTHVADIFAGVRQLHQERGDSLPPLLAMVSYAIMFRHGVDAFIDEAAQAGFAGFIVPDLPGDEAADCFAKSRERGCDLVQLVAPTTPRDRARSLLQNCSGFVYCLAVVGITGERDRVSAALHHQLRWLRSETGLPLAVGFGISKPEHAAALRLAADGVIVGTALVRHLDALSNGDCSREDVVRRIGEFAAAMNAAR